MTYEILLRRARNNRLAALSNRPNAKAPAVIRNVFADLD